MTSGSIVLAQNSVNAAEKRRDHTTFVRDRAHSCASGDVILVPEGLEALVK